MSKENYRNNEEIFSKSVRAARRTYFFDVKETKSGDYYLTITESKKMSEDGGNTFFYKKHKIYLFREDFKDFKDTLNASLDFIINEKGESVVSEKKHYQNNDTNKEGFNQNKKFTDINFDDV